MLMTQQGPTSKDLADACSEILTDEDRAEIADMPIDEALGYAFSLLIANGVEDPDSYLKDKGILE